MPGVSTMLGLCIIVIFAFVWNTHGEITVSGREMEGYFGMVVMVMDGKYDMTEANPFIPDCMSGMIYCNGVYFWKVVLHEDAAGHFRESRRYMLDKWGLNVSLMMEDGTLDMKDIYTDPRANHRAYVVPGESVHHLGWHVHNQAFQFTLRRPARLFGSSGKGRIVPTGTSFLYGQYLIQKSSLNKDGTLEHSEDYYRLKYESNHAIIPRRDMRAMVVCDVKESPWGSGISTSASFLMTSHLSKANWFIRTVITLDRGQGLGKFAGVFN